MGEAMINFDFTKETTLVTVFVPTIDFVVVADLDLTIMVGLANLFSPIDDFTPANSFGHVVRPFSAIHFSPVILAVPVKDLGPKILGFANIFVSQSLFIPPIQFGPVVKFVLVADYVRWLFWFCCPLLGWNYSCSNNLFSGCVSGCFRDPF